MSLGPGGPRRRDIPAERTAHKNTAFEIVCALSVSRACISVAVCEGVLLLRDSTNLLPSLLSRLPFPMNPPGFPVCFPEHPSYCAEGVVDTRYLLGGRWRWGTIVHSCECPPPLTPQSPTLPRGTTVLFWARRSPFTAHSSALDISYSHYGVTYLWECNT